MAGAAVPGHALDRVVGEQADRDHVEVGQRAERGTGEQGRAAVAGRGDGGGDGAAEHDLGERIHRPMLAEPPAMAMDHKSGQAARANTSSAIAARGGNPASVSPRCDSSRRVPSGSSASAVRLSTQSPSFA